MHDRRMHGVRAHVIVFCTLFVLCVELACVLGWFGFVRANALLTVCEVWHAAAALPIEVARRAIAHRRVGTWRWPVGRVEIQGRYTGDM